MTVNEIYNAVNSALNEKNFDDTELEARFILQKVLDFSYSDFLLKKNDTITKNDQEQIFYMLNQRLEGLPIQYILGEWDFMGETFLVGDGVLIPRPETEILVQCVIDELKTQKNPIVFDLCSGSGCIGISVKNALPNAKVYLVEKSDKALFYLRKNVEKFGFKDEITVIQGDILKIGEEFKKLPKPNIIVSNPPYIKSDELSSLQSEVQFEPKMALDGGEDGYIFYEKLTELWLTMIEKGSIMIECGEEQAKHIQNLFQTSCSQTQIIKDYNQIERIVIGRKN